MKPNLTFIIIIALALITIIILPQPISAGLTKRVAVVYFEDHSHFDSPTGCGLIPAGPFKFLFGSGDKTRQRWNLEAGFRDLLNQTLKNTGVYEPVGYEEIGIAFAELGLSRRDLKSEQNRARFADRLNVEALIVGDIRKFGQERLRGSSHRDVETVQGQVAAASTYGISGYTYSAHVKVDLIMYDGGSGKQIVTTQLEESATYTGGSATAGPLRTDVTKSGIDPKLIPAEKKNPPKRPIVEYKKLNRVRFGNYTPLQPGEEEVKFEDTLFGIATQKAMDKIIARLREEIGPESTPTTSPPFSEIVKGKVIGIYPSPNQSEPDVYINLGSSHGIKRGMQISVFTLSDELRDPDTGKLLGRVEVKVGMLEITEVQGEGLSKAKIIEGVGKIKLHDIVKSGVRDNP